MADGSVLLIVVASHRDIGRFFLNLEISEKKTEQALSH